MVCCAPGELNDVQYSIQILDSPVGLAPDGVSRREITVRGQSYV
jgi:hypothetical protein